MRLFVVEKCGQLVNQVVASGQDIIHGDLANWKCRQQKGEEKLGLESLQPFCGEVAALAWMLRQIIAEARILINNNNNVANSVPNLMVSNSNNGSTDLLGQPFSKVRLHH